MHSSFIHLLNNLFSLSLVCASSWRGTVKDNSSSKDMFSHPAFQWIGLFHLKEPWQIQGSEPKKVTFLFIYFYDNDGLVSATNCLKKVLWGTTRMRSLLAIVIWNELGRNQALGWDADAKTANKQSDTDRPTKLTEPHHLMRTYTVQRKKGKKNKDVNMKNKKTKRQNICSVTYDFSLIFKNRSLWRGKVITGEIPPL